MKNSAEQFPPVKWMHELNKEFPNASAIIKKEFFENDRIIELKDRGMKIKTPDWCYIPTVVPCKSSSINKPRQFESMEEMYAYANRIMTVSSMCTWNATKGIYRFDKEIYDSLIKQKLDGDIPCECLYHLPEWAVYVETPYGIVFEKKKVIGFIAHLDYNLVTSEKGKETDLQFVTFLEGEKEPRAYGLPIGFGTIENAVDEVRNIDKKAAENSNVRIEYNSTNSECKDAITSMIQLLLYLCSEEPDMDSIQHPKYRKSISGTVNGPREPRTWDVGVHISTTIRKYREQEKSEYTEECSHTHQSPRPHMRSAHWHTYWTGPKTEKQIPVIKWLPPIPVNMNFDTETPLNIHKVEC